MEREMEVIIEEDEYTLSCKKVKPTVKHHPKVGFTKTHLTQRMFVKIAACAIEEAIVDISCFEILPRDVGCIPFFAAKAEAHILRFPRLRQEINIEDRAKIAN